MIHLNKLVEQNKEGQDIQFKKFVNGENFITDIKTKKEIFKEKHQMMLLYSQEYLKNHQMIIYYK